MTKANKAADDFFDSKPKLESWEAKMEQKMEKWEAEEKQKAEMKAAGKSISIEKSSNSLASTFKVFAWIALILGGVCTFYGITEVAAGHTSSNGAVFLGVGLSVGIGGAVALFAIGEVIQILHDIRRKLYDDKK